MRRSAWCTELTAHFSASSSRATAILVARLLADDDSVNAVGGGDEMKRRGPTVSGIPRSATGGGRSLLCLKFATECCAESNVSW